MATKKTEPVEKQKRAVVTEASLPQVGGMRRQRVPKIRGEATGEIAKLQKKAVTAAGFLSHDVEVWEFSAEANAGKLRCLKCKLEGSFALFPMRGKDKINGPMFVLGGCQK